MMKIFALSVIAGTMVLASCTSVQLEKSKQIAMTSAKVSVSALPFMAKVTSAYGAPYALLVSAFAEALVPGFEAPEIEEDYDDDGEYSDEEYDDEYDEEYDDEYGGEDEYDEYSDYEDEDGYGSEDSAGDGQSFEDDSLSVQVNVIKERQTGQRIRGVPLKNGDTLTEDDNYKVQLRCNMECYAYIAQLDSTGRMDPIMPSSLVPDQNPLFSNQTYAIPQGSDWFYLDSSVGVEQIYFIFSLTPRDDIDLIFAKLASANERLVPAQPVSIDEPVVLSRGIAGVRQGARQSVQLSNGGQSQYISTVLESIEAELVMTKWFRHQ